MAKAHEDRFGVEALLARLRELRAEGTEAAAKLRLITDLRNDAATQHGHLHDMIVEGGDYATQATRVGRLWGASILADLEVIWGGWRTIVPPAKHERGDWPKHKRMTTWMVDAALGWPRESVDALDREVFELRMATEDKAEAAEWNLLRGALEVAIAWKTEATVDDRHVVPVSAETAPAVLYTAPPCVAFRGRAYLSRRVASLLEQATNEGMQAATGGGSARDRLRAADMATGRAQAFGMVLRMLQGPADDETDDDHEGLGEKCEGCPAEAVTRDSDGIPLCRACYDALPTMYKEGDSYEP